MNANHIGHDLKMNPTAGREQLGGRWVGGTVAGHKFQALVFRRSADTPAYELTDSFGNLSRISKLWIRRESDKVTVFNFDRGLDTPAYTRKVAAIIDFLCAGLADFA